MPSVCSKFREESQRELAASGGDQTYISRATPTRNIAGNEFNWCPRENVPPPRRRGVVGEFPTVHGGMGAFVISRVHVCGDGPPDSESVWSSNMGPGVGGPIEVGRVGALRNILSEWRLTLDAQAMGVKKLAAAGRTHTPRSPLTAWRP